MRRLALSVSWLVLIANAPAQSSLPTSDSGLDLSAIDKTADPCTDFYQYACGNWVKRNPIPADESSWDRFSVLEEQDQQVLRQILEKAEQHQTPDSRDAKIGRFYHSCMAEDLIEQLGQEPLRPELERIAHISHAGELPDEVARLQAMQVPVFFEFSSQPDPKDASKNIPELDQSGLGLPEKDFYTRTDDHSKDIRQKYAAHIAKMFELTGVPPPEAQAKAQRILALETRLALASLDVTSRRDPQNLVHEMPKSELDTLIPAFSFSEFFRESRAPDFTTLNVQVPQFFTGLNTLLKTEPLADLKDYLTWHYLNASANRLSKKFVDEHFDFFGRTLAGTKELKPRWKRCVSATDQQLGEDLGHAFVEKTFGEEGKTRTLELVHEIERQMADDLQKLSWMSPATKKAALIKLHAVADKIGYPDKWRDYSALQIEPDDYFGNWFRGNEFEYRRELNKIGKPVDRNEWEMTPPTVNAYYDPSQNNINFPAGILQPPFYSNKADDAVNYGSVGAIIGHELTHGFDDEGRQFDAAGNLRDWWVKSDEAKFKKLADCFVNEYGAYSPVPGVELNGRLTLGENTADNGGVRLAYLALLGDLARKSIPLSSNADGYTQTQQFFLSFGQSWCENTTPEMARLLAQTNPHSPGKMRANGVVSNLPEFSQAFGCQAGAKMNAAKGCRVW